MGFWIFRNDGELDNRYGVVKDGKNVKNTFPGRPILGKYRK